MKRLFFIIILLYLSTTSSFSQHYFFRHLSAAEGLLSDRQLSISEDRIGRLWIASDEGINIFDGNKLNYYSCPDNSGLINNNIQTIFCDKNGAIWLSSDAGIQYKKESDAKFSFLKVDDSYDNISTSKIIGQCDNGDIVLISKNNIYTINNLLQVKKSIIFNNKLTNTYQDILSYCYLNNSKWLLGFKEKLILIDVQKRIIEQEYRHSNVVSICKIDSNSVILGSDVNDNLTLMDIRSGDLERINDWKTSDSLPINGDICDIKSLGKNTYSLATRYNGVYILNTQDKYAEHLLHNPADPGSLKSNFCKGLFVSKAGVLFVQANGLSYTSTQNKPVSTQKYLINNKGIQYDGNFNDVVKDRKGNVWIATDNSVALWNRRTDVSTFYPFAQSKIAVAKTKPIHCITVDKWDRVWIGSEGDGMGMLLPDGTFEMLKHRPNDIDNSIPDNDILNLVNDHQQNIIICSNRGFALFNPATKKVQTFFKHSILGKIASNTTFYAITDAKNNWWLAQKNGLYYYDKIHDSLYHVGNLHQPFQALALAPNGDIYAGSNNGLFLVNSGNLITKLLLSKANGLLSNNIKDLVLDDKGMLWILSNRGLCMYDTHSRNLKKVDAKDGLTFHNLNNLYLSQDNEMLVAGTEGLNYFYPEQLEYTPDSLNVVIASIEMQDSIINYPDIRQLNLSYNQNSLTFSFLAVNYNTATSIQYRFKLLGLDTTYTYAGDQRQARYTNLPPGNYTFIVQASADGEKWFSANQQVHIKILPAFWNRWWFRSIILLLLWALIYAAYRYRVTQINKQAQLQTEYEVKLSELEMSALRTQMNPHFIFNSLNTINSFISLNNSEQANVYITKFSRLIRLILDHSRKRKITLEEEIQVVELYIQMEQIRFQNKFIYSIEISDDVEAANTEVPPLIIQPFVENSILHGLLPSVTKGLLKVSVFKQNDRIICTIYDNGIGREKAKVLRHHNRNKLEKRTSHGMEITLKRIELFNRQNAINDKVEVIDLDSPTGTMVKISLALQESY